MPLLARFEGNRPDPSGYALGECEGIQEDMRQASHILEVMTRGRGLYDISRALRSWIAEQGFHEGLLTLFIQHTSASLLIQENADPTVQTDLESFLSRLVPDGDPLFEHTAEGQDDMPSHVRAALTQTHLSIPVRDGELALGTWQGVYVYEHRRSAHRRTVALYCLGT
jgi:secondary thiamine-phosphate synthase enzyme